MEELGDKLVFKHGHSSPYYPQENGQVENKSLKTILQKNVSQSKYDPFQLVNGVESILPIECEIPSLKLEFSLLPDTSDLERHLVHLESLDEKHRDASTCQGSI
jgi:hypothetical protein